MENGAVVLGSLRSRKVPVSFQPATHMSERGSKLVRMFIATPDPEADAPAKILMMHGLGRSGKEAVQQEATGLTPPVP